MRGEVTAVLSAGYEEFFDNEDTLTPRTLVGRLFLSSAADGNRIICLGCLPGCGDATKSTAGVATPRIVPLPTGAPPRRKPAELSKDRDAYLHVVTLAQYAQMCSLSASNVKALVMQAVHLAETGEHAVVISTAIKVINTWALHTVSGTTSGVKQTMLDYVASIEDFCHWAAATPTCQPDGVIVPINRHVAVAFFEVEKERERSTTRRPPKRRRPPPPPPPRDSGATSSASAGTTSGASSGGGGGSRGVLQNRATGHVRPSALPSSARPGAAPSTVHPNFVGGGAPLVAASTSAYLPPLVVPPPPKEQRGQGAAATGQVGGAVNVDRGLVGRGDGGAHGRTVVAVRGRGAAFSATPVDGLGVTAHPRVGNRRARAGGRGGAAAIGSPVSGDAESGSGGNTTTVTTTHSLKVEHLTLKMHINALSKVASVINGLWSQCSCGSCSSFGADAFLTVGGCPAAKAVVEQCKRERYLKATALGVGKATGTRDPALPDDVRLPMVKETLLGPTSAADFHSGLITAALFVLSFSLEARGATTRGLRLSDMVMRNFPSMFTKAVDVLCTDVYATKTKENQVLCLGSLPHVNPWLCPFGAVADALVAACHRPSDDPHVPPVDFAPDFEPSDETLKAVGVEPRFYRANGGSAMGFRKWYHWVLLRSPRGDPYTGITYENHLARLKRAASGSGVPEKASLTHTARQGAAQKAKEAGASEADNNKYG
ncbi:hypothetical protein BU14_0082s0033 [Porphyra umbilicalis]|uniref:Uncharacterized protein n=1 Tax=Porphyra umbilicalis TaxID=2786 RepID=A0A1X6PEI4_PORUM|nr:hypothetical protein BU14_0082s0033 [Porphyra umbilicalis]|eukprot:OSX79268.1 hypothetical protein BU14_0082s0033 [Porphyra umbilicalis]